MFVETIKVISGLIVWVFILMGINSNFTDKPFLWVLIEAGASLLIYFIVAFYLQAREKEKLKYCKHDEERELCDICKEEKEQIRIEQEEKTRLSEIQKLANSLRTSEAIRVQKYRYARISSLLELTPKEFEDAIANLFVKLGYRVKQTPYTNDGGKDAIAYKNSSKFLIECKRYAEDKSIGRPILQKFHAAMVEENAEKGFFVTTARFTDTAIDYAKKFKIELIDSNKLARLYEDVYSNIDSELYFEQLCRTCGVKVIFHLYDEKNETVCDNGHRIRKEVPFIESSFTQPKKRKYRRYTRRY